MLPRHRGTHGNKCGGNAKECHAYPHRRQLEQLARTGTLMADGLEIALRASA